MGISSLATGQGERAVQGRLRYKLNLDESKAAALAELMTDHVCQQEGKGKEGEERK